MHSQTSNRLQMSAAGAVGKFPTWPLAIETLLESIGYREARRRVAEAMPYFVEDPDETDLLNVLCRLGINAKEREFSSENSDRVDLPGILIRKDNQTWVVLSQIGRKYRVIKPEVSHEPTILDAQKLKGRFLSLDFSNVENVDDDKRMFESNTSILRKFSSQIAQFSLVAFLNSLPGLFLPIITILIFDTILPAGSSSSIWWLFAAVMVVLFFDAYFRKSRAELISFTSARVSHVFGTFALSRVLALPSAMLENTPVKAQINRIRQFDRIGDQLTDQFFTFLIGVPQSMLFFTVFVFFSPWLWIVPLSAIVMQCILNALTFRTVSIHSEKLAMAGQNRDEVFRDVASSSLQIQWLGVGEVFWDRFRQASVEFADASLSANRTQSALEVVSQTITTLCALLTIVVGAFMVMAGDMSVGILLATMTIIWRILIPWQQLPSMLPKVVQFYKELWSFQQFTLLPIEEEGSPRRGIKIGVQHSLVLDSVTVLYDASKPPVLASGRLTINPHEFVAITGPSGSGKSTLLKLFNGMVRPNRGRVLLNGNDLRHINPRELRENIAYFSQGIETYSGTVLQNLLMAHPSASHDEIGEALRLAGLTSDLHQLEQGLNTRLGDAREITMNQSLLAQIALARTYIRKSPLILLDEPGRLLDLDADKQLVEALSEIRRSATIIMVSQRPSHLKLADRIISLEGGLLRQVTHHEKSDDRT